MDKVAMESWRTGACFITSSNTFRDYKPGVCLEQHPNRRSVLLMGDSHAASLYEPLRDALPGEDVLQATVHGCVGLFRQPATQDDDCKKMSKYIYGDFLVHHHIDRLVLAGRWMPADFDALGETLSWAKGKGIPVTLAGPNPEYDQPLPHLLFNNLLGRKSQVLGTHVNLTIPRLDRQMKQVSADKWHVPFASFYDAYCNPQCPVYVAPDVPLLRDNSHLTYEGGALFVKVIQRKGSDSTP